MGSVAVFAGITRRRCFTASFPLPHQDQEVFIDTLTIPTFKKKLKKLSAQDPGESRRRWHAVTEALWKKDVDTATEAKHEVSCGCAPLRSVGRC